MDEKTMGDLRKDMQQIQERVQTSSNYVQMIPNRSSSDEQARNIEQLQSMSCENVSAVSTTTHIGACIVNFPLAGSWSQPLYYACESGVILVTPPTARLRVCAIILVMPPTARLCVCAIILVMPPAARLYVCVC